MGPDGLLLKKVAQGGQRLARGTRPCWWWFRVARPCSAVGGTCPTWERAAPSALQGTGVPGHRQAGSGWDRPPLCPAPALRTLLTLPVPSLSVPQPGWCLRQGPPYTLCQSCLACLSPLSPSPPAPLALPVSQSFRKLAPWGPGGFWSWVETCPGEACGPGMPEAAGSLALGLVVCASPSPRHNPRPASWTAGRPHAWLVSDSGTPTPRRALAAPCGPP